MGRGERAYEAEHGAQLERTPRAWGVWSILESELSAWHNKDVLEFGFGASPLVDRAVSARRELRRAGQLTPVRTRDV